MGTYRPLKDIIAGQIENRILSSYCPVCSKRTKTKLYNLESVDYESIFEEICKNCKEVFWVEPIYKRH